LNSEFCIDLQLEQITIITIKILDHFKRDKPLSKRRLWVARGAAVAADGLQLLFFPLFSLGFISPLDDALDLGMSVFLSALVGWHWAFAPSVLVKLVPFADEAPTWTLAVLIATYRREVTAPASPAATQGKRIP